jgi:predicted adenine nucleotide alpha hydrolase (AANH) superfamily ATPase
MSTRLELDKRISQSPFRKRSKNENPERIIDILNDNKENDNYKDRYCYGIYSLHLSDNKSRPVQHKATDTTSKT